MVSSTMSQLWGRELKRMEKDTKLGEAFTKLLAFELAPGDDSGGLGDGARPTRSPASDPTRDSVLARPAIARNMTTDRGGGWK